MDEAYAASGWSLVGFEVTSAGRSHFERAVGEVVQSELVNAKPRKRLTPAGTFIWISNQYSR